MRIAVLGAGFAGLATAWNILELTQGSVTVDIYDPHPIGEGISGLSSGLLHPYGGKHAKRSWMAWEGMHETHRLITQASIGAPGPIVISKGVLRPATTQEQQKDFYAVSQQYEDTQWWDRDKCLETVPGLYLPTDSNGGLYVDHGLGLDVPAYLRGLWKQCALLGCQFHQTALIKQKDLKPFDRVVFALGYAVKFFKPLAQLPIAPIKGQIVLCKWPYDVPPLPLNLVGQGYLTMTRDGSSCIAGTTYEREFKNPNPEPTWAFAEIKKKILPFFPSFERAEMQSCRAGIRASYSKTHLPLIGRISEKHWFFTGLGSKGLLYHAWLGRKVAEALVYDEPFIFPREVFYSPFDQVM